MERFFLVPFSLLDVTRPIHTEANKADLNVERYCRFEGAYVSAENLQFDAVLEDMGDSRRRQSLQVIVVGHRTDEVQVFTSRLAPHVTYFFHGE